jgi:DNA-binding MarR family transcriptional regulator
MNKSLLKRQAERLFAAVEKIERSFEHDLIGSALDLTKPQLRTLMAVSHAKFVTMGELGKLTGYPTSALTGIIDRMVRKKLVRRVRGDDDRRVVKVIATPVGTELAANFHRKLMRALSVVLEKMEPDGREKMVSMVEVIARGFVKKDEHWNRR